MLQTFPGTRTCRHSSACRPATAAAVGAQIAAVEADSDAYARGRRRLWLTCAPTPTAVGGRGRGSLPRKSYARRRRERGLMAVVLCCVGGDGAV